MSDPIVLPPIFVYATEPNYPSQPQGPGWPAPNPAMVFGAQQEYRNGFYANGQWREMILKLTNEQQFYMKNGPLTSVIEGFVRDLQAVPFADNYICTNPSQTPAQALWYTTRNFKAGSVPQSKGLSGGSLTPVAALGHFVYGKGHAAETNINSLGLRPSTTPIPALENAFAAAPVGTSSIVLDKVSYNTADDSWMTGSWLGHITLKIEGTVTKTAEGRITFNGSARAYNDIYDANPSNYRSALGESATSVLAEVQRVLKAQPYEISIAGSIPVSISR
nr:lipid II-degrading bacteriocin [uncultured Pseudomonas sp.]